MAFFMIPSYIQKRLLRYALSHFPVVDTDTLDLEQLDIAWGMRSTVELRDVGLHVKKLSHMLLLPKELQPTKARIVSLRITVPADLYSSAIEVDVQGIDIQVRLNRKEEAPPTDNLKSSRSRGSHEGGARSKQPHFQDEEDDEVEDTDHLPTAEELAESFLVHESEGERQELEAVIQNVASQHGDDSDETSEASDEDLGAGVGLSTPAFLANFLKGVIDRLQMSIFNVKFILDAELLPDDDVPLDSPSVSLHFGVRSLGIDGFTKPTTAIPENPDLDERRAKSRRIHLQDIYGDLVTEKAMFSRLQQISGTNSRHLARSTSSLSQLSQGLDTTSPQAPLSPSASYLFRQRHAAASRTSHLSTGELSNTSIWSDPSNSRLRTPRDRAFHETERYADVSDDGFDSMQESQHSDLQLSSSLTPSHFAPSEIEDVEEDLPFSMDDAHSSQGYDNQEMDPFNTLGASYDADVRSKPRKRRKGEADLTATAPTIGSRRAEQGVSDRYRLAYNSEPVPQASRRDTEVPYFAPDESQRFSYASRPKSDSSGSPSSRGDPSIHQDLSQSMMFSHEEAESMYMSAFSEASSHQSQYKMPGAWGRSSESSDESEKPRRMDSVPKATPGSEFEVEGSGAATPRAGSPSNTSSSESQSEKFRSQILAETSAKATSLVLNEAESFPKAYTTSPNKSISTKRLFSINEISVWVPWSSTSSEAGAATTTDPSASVNPQQRDTKNSRPMPGAFSQYHSIVLGASKIGQPRPMHAKFATETHPQDSLATLPDGPSPFEENPNPTVGIDIGEFMCHLDTSSTRLLYRLVQQVMEAWTARPQPPPGKLPDHNQSPRTPLPVCNLKLERFTLAFLEHLSSTDSRPTSASPSTASSRMISPLFKMDVQHVDVKNQEVDEATQVKLKIQTFKFGYDDEPIISFEKSLRKRSTTQRATLSEEADVEIEFKNTPSRGPELDVITLPVKVTLSLQKLDERLTLFGGVSGMLDLSSSIASNSTVLAPSPVINARAGKVHFGNLPVTPTTPTLSPVKINARFHGVKVVLEGRACAVHVEIGLFSAVVRDTTARVRVDRIKVRAPYDGEQSPINGVTLDLMKTEMIFLTCGMEKDFEDLVALIEPSGDRFGDDDGFLMDMLRRQRMNGSVLRVEIGEVQAKVSHLEHTERLQLLFEELGRLSNGVTKYLPEDDRPGILILPKVQTLHVEAIVNDKLGLLDATCEKIGAAFVGVPFLIGYKIGSVNFTRDGHEVIAPLLDLPPETPTPMVMGRLIGNEPEARLKIKLFNILVEYKIPTILALLGISEVDTIEDLAMSMAGSIATLHAETSPPESEASAADGSRSSAAKKPIHVDVLVRDCAIGLNPAKSDAKALFVLSQTQVNADETSNVGFQVNILMKRASLLLVDDVNGLNLDTPPSQRSYDSDTISPAAEDLHRQGFQPVVSIWAAQTFVNISRSAKEETLVDVTLTNKLFTLETCADSTSTLATVLGGLAPPLPKKKQQMYRTQVVPIEDMMASFSGEAFPQTEASTHLEPVEEQLDMEDADYLDEDIPTNLDFVGSFYNPEDDTAQYEPSVMASVNRLSSRILSPSRNEKVSFASSIEEKFEHRPNDSTLNLDEDYVEILKLKAPVRKWNYKKAQLEPILQSTTRNSPVKITAKIDQVTWNLYDGYDWTNTRDKIAQKVEELENKAEQRRRQRHSLSHDDGDDESEVGDMLFQSIWIAIPPNAGENDLRRGINQNIADEYSETGSTRTTSVDTRVTSRPIHKRRKSRSLKLDRGRRKISFDLKNVVADVLVLPPGSGETQDSVALRVGELEIFDHVPSSTWKKFMTYLHDAGERQMGVPMVRLDVVTVRPVIDLAATEMIIKAKILPVRLHVDQDALDFITRFFEFKDDAAPPSSGTPGPYIARLEVNTIPVRLDYKPKTVNYAGLRSGYTSEFANFFVLDGASFKLNRIILYGVQSPDLLQNKLKDIWTDDVIKNQLPTVLSGLAALRPFVDVGSGIKSLIDVPIQEYRKDGRVVRSIQKGAIAFAKNTTSGIARLGAKVAISTQSVLEGAEGLLSPALDRRPRRRAGNEWDIDELSTSPSREETRAVSNYADQPLNVMTGLRSAWQGLERDLVTAKDAIIAIGGDVKESSSASGAAVAVARLAPTVILRPAIGATRAVGTAFLGVGNQLDKDSRRKVEDKYKRYG